MATVPDTQIAGLSGSDRDAAVALTNLFASYGLESLAPKIVQFIQQGYSNDTIAIELQNTAEYKQRFAANDTRIKAGLPALSPAEYVSTERAYRQVMSQAGLPVGFYDSHSDFQKFLEQDISPTEIKSRVDAAQEAIYQAPKETLDFIKQWYNAGDLVAFALDPTRAAPLVEQRLKAAEAAGYGKQQGVDVSQATAETLGQQGFTASQLQQGFGTVGLEGKALGKLGEIYGGAVTSDEIVKEVFLNDAASTEKVKKLASQERAAFSATSGASRASLGTESKI